MVNALKLDSSASEKRQNDLGGIEEASSENQFHNFGLVPDFPCKLLSLTADRGQHPTDPIVTVNGDA